MCGIVGYIGKEKCIPIVINGLESLEYRGYDSSGIAYKVNGEVIIKKEVGRIENLKNILTDEDSFCGIGHTRWATHGRPCKENGHPHRVGCVTLVHNGIIENYAELKSELTEYTFKSETDTEVAAALIDKLYKEEKDVPTLLNSLKKHLIGSYALGIMFDGDDNLYAIRNDSPLIIGVSDSGNFIASDVPAILKYTKNYYLLLNHEYVVLTKDSVSIYNDGNLVNKELLTFEYDLNYAMKNGYDHFMLKEIYEQPDVVKNTVNEYASSIQKLLENMDGLEKFDGIDIVGCGSAYHVGLVGKYLISKYSDVNVYVDIASEYRYTNHSYSKNHLIILISQSGETADTLAVLRDAKEKGISTLAIVNAVGSSIARESDKVIYIKAGPEIAVATTKAYVCQLTVLSLIALYLGIKNNRADKSLLNEFLSLNETISKLLEDTTDCEEIAELIHKGENLFFIGRKIDYALCLEGSLKLKEISYIHSEAYAAGELKHGSISLIDKKTPVISIVTDEDIKLKTISNIKEVCARDALSIIITNDDSINKDIYNKIIVVPKLSDLTQGILVIIKCQLISYYVAKLRGCDIDKPRNLAKSVTVE